MKKQKIVVKANQRANIVGWLEQYSEKVYGDAYKLSRDEYNALYELLEEVLRFKV